MRNQYDEDKAVTSLKQLKKELQAFTEKTLHEKFRWTTVENWIMEILRKNVEDIVMSALGYKFEDSFGRGRWELKDCGERRGVQKVIGDMAGVLVAEHLPALIEARKKAINEKLLSPANRKKIAENFGYTFDKMVREKMEEWVTAHTAQQIEEIFERHGEGFLENIKLKRKLTMESLALLGGDGD